MRKLLRAPIVRGRETLTLSQAAPTDDGGRLTGIHGPARRQTYRIHLSAELHGFVQSQERDVVVLKSPVNKNVEY